MGNSTAGQGWHAPLQQIRAARITKTEVVATNRSAHFRTRSTSARLTAAAARHNHRE
jgi:hypothetical protein